ncbi:alpha/beta hydrolase [Candidatus Protochlamydia phocaeensis]|uniref:alpha/beta hydrolase n=1 Tax=Candidatus Protochlamydia phocaeensis TaxID=1414722 RepID=UPI000838EBE1|nr:alpha/beta fold hydrolase [Candidatus Protochlamydia phocaeensis]
MQKVEERESITLVNGDEKIFAMLHRPLHASKVPAVLICSGFAGTKCGKSRLFVRLGKELAKRGIAVLRFDYRGAGDSEGEFNDITIESQLSDTLLCLNYLANDPQIDATRIGLLGRSLGGALAVMAATRFQSIKSLALWAPVFTSDPWKKLWEAYKTNKQEIPKKDIMQMLPSSKAPNMEFIHQFFEIDIKRELEKLKDIPMLHVHGTQDVVVQSEHTDAYKKAREATENTRFILLSKSDHDFSDPAEQEILLAETSEWYQKTLFN